MSCKDYLDRNCSKLSLLDRFSFYIHAQVAIFNYDETEHSDYYSAWVAYSVKHLKAYLPQLAISGKVFNEFTKVAKSVSSVDFLNNVVPGLIAAEAERVFEKLDPQQTAMMAASRNHIYLLIRIMGCLLFRDYLNTQKYPAAPSRISLEEMPNYFDTAYEAWPLRTQYDKLVRPTFRADLFALWQVVVGIPYDIKQASKVTGVSGIVTDLRELGLNDSYIFSLFSTVKLYEKIKVSKPNDPMSYLRKIVLDNIPTITEDGHLTSPAEYVFLSDQLLGKCITRWSKTDTIDFVRSLLFGKAGASVAIENVLALPLVNKAFSTGKNKQLLVDANPNLIVRIAENEDVATGIVFAFFDLTLAQLYKERFPTLCFMHITFNEEVKKFVFKLLELDSRHRGRESRFFMKESVEDFDQAILFVHQEKNARLTASLFFFLSSNLKTCNFMLFAPHSFVESLNKQQKVSICSMFQDIKIQVLPASKKYAWLHKNLVMQLNRDTERVEKDIIHISKYSTIGEKLFLDPWSVEVPSISFANEEGRTINNLWEIFRPKREAIQKRTSLHYRYSKEIIIWYSYSSKTLRGKYHFHACPTLRQRKVNHLSRGKRITDLKEFRAHDISQAEGIMREAIFKPDLYEVIQKEITHAYKNQAISLKSFWYCNLAALEKISGFKRDLSERLLETPLADFMSDKAYSLEDYTQVFDECFHKETEKTQFNLWQQLNIILNYAGRYDRFSPNPLREFMQRKTEQAKDIQDARRAMAKRSYEEKEEQLMLQYYEENWKNHPQLIGAIISFYTGMSTREILALDWSDVHEIFDDYCQFWVHKKMITLEEIRLFPDSERYSNRRVPIASALLKYLLAYKDYVKSILVAAEQFDEKLFKNMPIVFSKDGKFEKRCSPDSLLKAKRAMEEAANIVPMDIGDGDRSTDINNYESDRFRSNFVYRMSQTCKMSQSELNYLLGKLPPTTFSKHYCDYANDFAQMLLCNKIDRWKQPQSSCDEELNCYKIPTSGRALKLPVLDERTCVHVSFAIKGESQDPITVVIKNNHSVDIKVRRERRPRR